MNKLDREALVLDNLGLAKRVAHRYIGRVYDSAVSWDDLYSEGCLALVVASRKYEPGKGVKFTTFAWHYIWGYVLRAFDCKGYVHVPVHIRECGRAIIKRNLESHTAEEIAVELKVSRTKAYRALMYIQAESTSLDKSGGGNNRGDRVDADLFTGYNFAPDYEDYTTAYIEDFKTRLKPRLRECLELRLKGKEYREISGILGITFQGAHNRMVKVKKALEEFQMAGGL